MKFMLSMQEECHRLCVGFEYASRVLDVGSLRFRAAKSAEKAGEGQSEQERCEKEDDIGEEK